MQFEHFPLLFLPFPLLGKISENLSLVCDSLIISLGGAVHRVSEELHLLRVKQPTKQTDGGFSVDIYSLKMIEILEFLDVCQL